MYNVNKIVCVQDASLNIGLNINFNKKTSFIPFLCDGDIDVNITDNPEFKKYDCEVYSLLHSWMNRNVDYINNNIIKFKTNSNVVKTEQYKFDTDTVNVIHLDNIDMPVLLTITHNYKDIFSPNQIFAVFDSKNEFEKWWNKIQENDNILDDVLEFYSDLKPEQYIY